MQTETRSVARSLRGAEGSVSSAAGQFLDRFVFLLLLGVIALSAVPYGSVSPGSGAIIECSIYGLGMLWAIQGFITGKLNVRGGRLLLPLGGILLLALVQILPVWSFRDGESIQHTISVDPYETKLWIQRFGVVMLSAALLYSYVVDQNRLRWIVHLLIAIGVASALFGLFRQLAHIDLPVATDPQHSNGAYGQFLNRNHFSLLMEMTLGLTLGLIVKNSSRFSIALLYVASAIVLWLALVMANSRGGVVSMLGQFLLVLVVWLSSRRTKPEPQQSKLPFRFRKLISSRITRVALGAGFLLVLIAGVFWIGGDSLLQRWELLPRELSTDATARQNASRLFIWRATASMIRSNPIAGVGLGAYHIAFPFYHDASGTWVPQQAHNDYLELVASGGVVAAAFACWFFVSLTRGAWRQLKQADRFRSAACFGAIIGLVGVLLHSFVDFGLHVMVNSLICVGLIVIATATTSNHQPASLR